MSGLETSMIKARTAEKRGDLAEAERLYAAVLEKFPRNARARKRLDDLFKSRAIAQIKTDAPPQWQCDELVERYRQGQMIEVINRAQALLRSHPRAALVHNLLGAAYLNLELPAEAETALRVAYSHGVRMPAICNNLGMAIAAQGRHEEALEFYREAIRGDPSHAIAHNNIGNSLKECGKPTEALSAYVQAVAIQPDYTDAYNNMGLVLAALGRRDEALSAYEKALALQPDHAAAHNSLGNLRASLGDLTAAIACYETALAIRPAYPEAWFNLGNVFNRQGRMHDANLAYARAKVVRPAYADASAAQGKALALEGRYEEALAAFDEALAIDPDHAGALAHRLFYQAHICAWSGFDARRRLDETTDTALSPWAALTFEDDPARQLRRSRAWARHHIAQRPAGVPAPAMAKDGRIRIGYFSADFQNHATSYLLSGLLREHDRSRFVIHAFSYGPAADDDMRRQLVAATDSFTDADHLPDSKLVELARSRELDVAIDLKGYTLGTRMEPFALRLAPLQISYLGFPGSSGAEFIDYLVADPVVIPAAERDHYSEKLILLPGSYQPNDNRRAIAESSGSRADWNLPEAAFVFCCFNHTYKITPREFDVWMRLLGRVEHSVLWLLRSNPWAERNLQREAEARGIAAERIIFADSVPQAQHLARIRHADLFLDTFNVNAHTTASDSLWAGVPVVTLAGRQFAARVCASLLTAVGLPELVTENEAAYEASILGLANEPGRLAAIRTKLADNRLSQPLFDTVRYTRAFEAALAAVHQRRVDGLAPTTLSF